MSNISDRHSVVPFVSGETKALSGQRLAKVGYKDRGANKARFTSVAVSVPHIDPAAVQAHYNRLLPHFGTFLEGVQDAVLRSLYESSEGTLQSVSDDAIGMQACVNFLEAESNGSRLTAESIKQWFRAECAENLTVWIAEKLGFEELNTEQVAVIEKKLAAYEGTFSTIAGKNVFLEPHKIVSLRNALALCAESGSDIGGKIEKKLIALSEAPKVEELL
jgi:hypothetical protein